MADKSRSFAVIGLGSMGSTIAKQLMQFGDYVIGVDCNEAVVNRMADDLSESVILDARDQNALREAGIAECDVAIIGIGNDLESNMMAAINARLIGIKTVWAKAGNRNHHRILSRIGVDRVVNPEVDHGRAIAEMLHNPQLQDFVSVGNGFHVVVFRCPERMAGKSLKDLALPEKYDLRCLGVMRGTTYLGGDDCAEAFEEGDRLLLLGRRQDLRKLGAAL